jgi:undecaprenyl-phosphate galactose phosphotransferase
MFPIRIVLFTGGEPRAQLKTQTTVLSKLGYDTLRVVPLKGDHEESTVHGVILDRTLELNPDQIFLQQEDFSGETFRNTLRAAESTGRPVRVFSTLSIFQLRANIRNLDGLILYDLNSGLGRPFSRIVKRTMDVVGAAVLLILLAPLFPILGILIRLDSPGPIFFRHRRLDSRGRIFRCWKFRTMYPDAEERLRNWMENGDSRVKEFDTAFKLKDDPRITRIGKILRRTSLDELPQLFNVLCGQMSLVGPRPIVSEETAKYGSDFQYLLMAKGGMTGISQVSGRNDLDYSERIALDCFYVRNWSIWADIVILLKTLGAVLTRSGAY